jgi:hypothetical protein
LPSSLATFQRLYLYTVLRLVYLVFKKLLMTSFAFAFSVSLRLIIIYSPSKELSFTPSRFGTFFIFCCCFRGDFFNLLNLRIAPDFFPVRFGTAKVETFFYFPKLIFFIFLSPGGLSFLPFLLSQTLTAQASFLFS